MNHHRRSRSCLGALLLAATAACGGGAPYRVAELGLLPSVRAGSSQAFGINRHNQVVGYVREGATGPRRAVLWEPDGRVVEITLGAAWDINDSREVVGGDATGGLSAFRWSSGRLRAVEVPAGAVGSEAMAIGPNGDIVGWYEARGAPPSQRRTFVWSDGRARDLGPHHAGAGGGFGVEKHGQVVGMRLADPADPRSPNHAFLWYDNVARDLGTLPGGGFSSATDIVVSAWPPDAAETRFTIIGESVVGDGPVTSNIHGFVYTRGRMRDMGTLPGFPRVIPAALNGRGVAVGTMESSDRTMMRAFMYGGVLLDLNTLIGDDTGWVLESATDINEAGFIVGWGQFRGERRAFLLSPR